MTGKVQQLHEVRNLVMLESVFGWILSGSLKSQKTMSLILIARMFCVEK